MKVPASVRAVFDDQLEVATRLKDHVDSFVSGIRRQKWHYESRIKELQSFALKIESGRVRDPRQLEDFFACTLVVTNFKEVSEAVEAVKGLFDLAYKRPKDVARTHKQASGFDFDDLRLYLKVKTGAAAPVHTSLVGQVFEMQIKTYLQHAWSIATHDLIYKADDASWAKERVAYQVKAMLEHAELTISEVDNLAASSLVAMEDCRTSELRNFVALVQEKWLPSELPSDVRRLAANLQMLCNAVGMSAVELGELLDSGKARRGGLHPLNLSPYATVLQYLLEAARPRLEDFLRKAPTGRDRRSVLFARELEIPDGLSTACERVIRV